MGTELTRSGLLQRRQAKRRGQTLPDLSPRGELYSRPSTRSIPASTSSRSASLRCPTRSESTARSTVTICETLATESFGNPVRSAGISTLPGAAAQRRLLVSGTTTTVAIRLALNASPWTTITGRRNPGPDPVEGGRDAQTMSPWLTTTRCARGFAALLRRARRPAPCRAPRRVRRAHA